MLGTSTNYHFLQQLAQTQIQVTATGDKDPNQPLLGPPALGRGRQTAQPRVPRPKTLLNKTQMPLPLKQPYLWM